MIIYAAFLLGVYAVTGFLKAVNKRIFELDLFLLLPIFGRIFGWW